MSISVPDPTSYKIQIKLMAIISGERQRLVKIIEAAKIVSNKRDI
jgi:hypothetical protein